METRDPEVDQDYAEKHDQSQKVILSFFLLAFSDDVDQHGRVVDRENGQKDVKLHDERKNQKIDDVDLDEHEK